MTKNEMKNLVREDFRNDPNNTLIGFLEVENDVEGFAPGFFEAGRTLIVYQDCKGEIAYEELREFVNNLLDDFKG